ncbi:D-cysteine desulfhydrase [Actinidia rufa]|uniref:D-cysteine desulfhydrase n=1 Tax=Actinidia rufa TaxID=165716 RepID=A0A7J0FJS2_9ERIC|nr:D-cysteine desulfhydrase [Actinidia rufa]
MTAIVASTPTTLHGKSGIPTWILNSGINNHITSELSTFTSPITPITQSVCITDRSSIPIRSQGSLISSGALVSFKIALPIVPNLMIRGRSYFSGSSLLYGTATDLVAKEGSAPPCLLPILKSPPPSPSGSLPFIVTTYPSQVYYRRALSLDPLPTSSPESRISSPLVSDIPSPRYLTRVCHPSFHFLLSNSTNHPVAQYLSYQGLSNSYQSFRNQVDSVMIPRSVHEAFHNLFGKAAYGMMKDMAENPKKWEGRNILFIHTGGQLGLFDKTDQMESLVGNWCKMDIDDDSIPCKNGTGH